MSERESVVERLRRDLEDFKGIRADEDLGVPIGELRALLAAVEAAKALLDTHEIQMYVGDEAVSGGHIGYCSRTLSYKLDALY